MPAVFDAGEDSPQSQGDYPHSAPDYPQLMQELLSLAERARLKAKPSTVEMQSLVQSLSMDAG